MKRLLDPARRGTQPCKLRTPRFGTKRAPSTAQGEARDTATWLARHDRLPDGEGEGVPEEARRRPAPLSCLSLFHSPGEKGRFSSRETPAQAPRIPGVCQKHPQA